MVNFSRFHSNPRTITLGRLKIATGGRTFTKVNHSKLVSLIWRGGEGKCIGPLDSSAKRFCKGNIRAFSFGILISPKPDPTPLIYSVVDAPLYSDCLPILVAVPTCEYRSSNPGSHLNDKLGHKSF